jgi:DNA-binding NtrC family response regulator
MSTHKKRGNDVPELLGLSPAIKRVRRMVSAAARTDEKVLLVGEAGVGKAQMAQLIHERSERSDEPFVTVDCRELGISLTWSDLYGEVQENGGAVRRKVGAFEKVGRGTLYLSNLDALSLDDQKIFYSILSSGTFRRDQETVELDCRVIASMERDPSVLIENGTFRRDLYVLFGGVFVYIPPLRERLPDLVVLFEHFLERYCEENNMSLPTVPSELFESMMHYEWPGNVRELGDTVRNLVLMSPEGQLSPEYLPFTLKKDPLESFLGRKLGEATAEVEKFLIRRTLQRFGWNQARTAKALALSEPNLRYKMKKYGIRKEG